MKKIFALLLTMVLLTGLASVSLADNASLFDGKLIGIWENYSPAEELPAAQNDIVVTADSATRGTRTIYFFPGETNSGTCYMTDFYNGEWHIFTVVMAQDGLSFVIFRPNTDIANFFRKR